MSQDFSHRDFKDKAFQPLAFGLGQAALAWNDLLVSISGLFAAILKIPNRVIPNTVWFTITSDRDQINLVRRLAASRALGITIPTKIRTEIKWLTTHATDLIDPRNDLLHSPFVNSGGTVGPFHLGAHTRAIKYSETREILSDCAWFYDAAIILRNWAEELEEALTDSNYALPGRPVWRARPNRNSPPPQAQN